MKKWLFLWSSKRQPIWESTLFNINVAVGSKETISHNGGQIIPDVNLALNPRAGAEFSGHCGQILSQFENEAFKFVIEKNQTKLSPQTNQLIIKPYMFLNMGLDETNCKPFNLDDVGKYLETNEWCALGLFINGNSDVVYNDRANTLSKATWYTRKDNYKVYDLVRDEYLPNEFSLNVITYIVFRKLADSEIILGYVNHHLVSLPAFDTDVSRDGKHTWAGANIMDSGMFDCLINPTIKYAQIHGDIIIANSNFEIRLYEDSDVCTLFDYIPKFNVELITNLKVSAQDNKYTIEKGNGYLIFKIKTNEFTQKYTESSEAGIYTLSYKVYGD